MKLLDGKVAVVTGAARGIGKAIALEFAKEGANVAFTDLAIDENGKATEAEIAALGVKAKGYASNAANFEETHAVIDQIIKDFGRIDILVNNAGITKDGLMMRMSEAQWDAVLTVNLNRCVQQATREGRPYVEFLEEVVDLVHKVQTAYDANLRDLQAKGMLPLFDAGYINLSRQYLTVGVNGLVEAAESLGLTISDNPDYEAFVQEVLGLVERYNRKYRTRDLMFNCEMIPAENVGVKHARWDREDGYYVPRDCYNSYFYVVEDENTTVLDKFRLHGRRYIAHLTGGSALHCNLDAHLSQPQYRQLLRVAAREGCNYFTFNIPNTLCNQCGHIDKRYLQECPHCHSRDVDYLTRVIGYLKRVSNFSLDRQREAARRHYAHVLPAEATEPVEAEV